MMQRLGRCRDIRSVRTVGRDMIDVRIGASSIGTVLRFSRLDGGRDSSAREETWSSAQRRPAGVSGSTHADCRIE